MARVTPETSLKRAIKGLLKANGWMVVPILQGLGSYKGVPDFDCTRKGVNIKIEVKSPRGRQSEHQKRYQVDLEEHGGTYLLINNIDDLIDWLERNNGINRRVGIAPERVMK
jgi:hypothetical protein